MNVNLILYTLIVLKELAVFIPPTDAVSSGCDCLDRQYCHDSICVDCNRCYGQGAAILCSEFNDSVCEPCAYGTYSALSVEHSVYRCYPCTKCEPDRVTIANCTSEYDTTCGPCPRGKFAWDNGTCLECSLCPNDPSIPAIRYTECQLNGAPRNYMCAPGACINCVEDSTDVMVNLSVEGGWVTRKTDEIIFDKPTEPPTQDTTAVAAVSITVASIVGLLAIFVSVFATWLLRGLYCRNCRSLRRENWRRNDGSAMYLMSATSEEASEEEGISSSAVQAVSLLSLRYPANQHVLPSLKLLDIIGFIKEVEHKWSSVAEALGVSRDVIAEIDRTCNSVNAECCRVMLDKWLKSAESCSWGNIIEACNRNFLHSLAIKLQIFYSSDKSFCESDVVLWDYIVDQIKRVSQKRLITQKWCSQFDDTILELNVTIQGCAYSLEDAIILLAEDECPRPIVLLGEAGAGKTTMVLQIVHNWCRIGSSSRFALEIYVDMATDANKITDLPSLINLCLERAVDVEMVDSMCNTLVKQQGKGLLIILDGFDEVQDKENNVLKELLYSAILPQATLLLVSRPGYVTNIDYTVKTIEVPLLRYDQVQLYVQNTVGHRGVAVIRYSPIRPMLHNPLLLAIVCHLIYHGIDVTGLNTLTQLYYNLVIKLISDQVRSVTYSDSNHSATVRSLVNSCAEASYKAMLDHQHLITDVHNIDNIVESGLLVKHKESRTFYFAHYTFMEFFAAYHVAHSSELNLPVLKVNPGDSLLLPFVSGITGKIAYRTEEIDSNSLVVASVCYSEAKSPVAGQQHSSAIVKTFPSGVLALNNYVCTPHQQVSLKLFMQECDEIEELDISGFVSNEMVPSNRPLFSVANQSNTSSDKLKLQPSNLAAAELLNCKNLTATNINITTDEWLMVGNMLSRNTSLVSLNLSHNTSIANDNIIGVIANSLTVNDHLQTLLLSYCNLTSAYAEELMKALLSNTCLLQIDLSNNLIEQLNVTTITKVLQHGIIQEIKIADNPITEELQSKLMEIAHHNHEIKL